MYAQLGDFARMQYASDYVGAVVAQDGAALLLGGRSSLIILRRDVI